MSEIINKTIVPVLLAGGQGNRLWPLSRKSYPKQFANLISDLSLFQQSAIRLIGPEFTAPVIVTSEDYRFIVREQLADVGLSASSILIEPSAKNTAPAVLAAALDIVKENPDAVMLVAPSDHVISDSDAFRKCLQNALPSAVEGRIVTFGIIPDRPETGYGYLQVEGEILGGDIPMQIKRFVEKPNLEAAKRMLEAGSYFWNAGIFLFSIETILEAYKSVLPEMFTAVEDAVTRSTSDLEFTRLDVNAWENAQSISIDNAIMEKVTNLSVIPFNDGWSDLGSWASIWQMTNVNGLSLSSNATAIDCESTMLRSESEGQVVVGIGLKDIVAVATTDAVLIAHKSEAEKVKNAVAVLKDKQLAQAETFPKDHRPWGWFENLAQGQRFQVKRIVVKSGGALSLQSHHHRSEHWIVVSGTAKVTVDDETKLVLENQSVYIPLGAVHRLENPGKLPMVLIEVQVGAYLGEDDIIRYEDAYERK